MSSQRAWIVVAEDNAPDVFLIREALKAAGLLCRLDTLADGEDAFNLIDRLEGDRTQPFPDLFIIDLNLPRRSGSEVLSRVRSSARGAKSSVIVMSSSDASCDRDMARKLGANHYFRKPADLDEFMQIGGCIRALLDGNQGAGAPVDMPGNPGGTAFSRGVRPG